MGNGFVTLRCSSLYEQLERLTGELGGVLWGQFRKYSTIPKGEEEGVFMFLSCLGKDTSMGLTLVACFDSMGNIGY